MTLAASLAVIALLLSGVGTYGVMSVFVRQRRREIAIRIALGATPASVRGLVFREGFAMCAAGLLLGTALALSLGRLIQPLLFQVGITDPVVLVATIVWLLIAMSGATMLPIRQAARTDPLAVLRSE